MADKLSQNKLERDGEMLAHYNKNQPQNWRYFDVTLIKFIVKII